MSKIGKARSRYGASFPVQAGFQGTTQDVAVGGSSTQSAAFGANTTLIEIVATEACRYKIGTNPTAADSGAGGTYLHAGNIKTHAVTPGDKIAVIKITGGAGAGLLNITEYA